MRDPRAAISPLNSVIAGTQRSNSPARFGGAIVTTAPPTQEMQMRPNQAPPRPATTRRRRWPAAATILAGLVAIATAAGWWNYGAATPPQTPVKASPTANHDFSTVVIVSTRNKDTCHQYKLDGMTGALKNELPDSCINSDDRGRGAGVRLEAISRGFRER
jgi:hypothetical protein